MATAFATHPVMPSTVRPSIALVIPTPPARLPYSQRRAIVRSGELAIARGLRIIGRSAATYDNGGDGARVWIVTSASRPGLDHWTWIEDGRIMCDCEARQEQHTFTCSHAQLVRITIVAERAAAAISSPAPAAEPAAVAPECEPEPEPPTPAPSSPSGPRGPRCPRCPSCAGPVDATELAELGECLNCLQMRADYERAEREEFHRAAAAEGSLPCWACGAIATAETAHGLYCDDCISLPEKDRRSRARARQKDIARQIKAEKAERAEKARAGIPAEPRRRTRRAKVQQTQTVEQSTTAE